MRAGFYGTSTVAMLVLCAWLGHNWDLIGALAKSCQ